MFTKLLKFAALQFYAMFGPRFVVSDTDADMHIIQFNDAVKELAGGPMKSYLLETCTYEDCEGESALIGGGYKPNLTAGSDTALDSITSRHSYDQLGSPTLANAIDALMTGNDTVDAQRTQVLPREIKVEKWFQTAEKNFVEMTDPTSRKLKNLMQGYYTKLDLRFMAALFASSVTRVTGNAATPTTTSSVSMPASQILDDRTFADIDIDIFSEVKEKFETQYVNGERIYLGMGPKAKRNLIQNSRDKLTSRDFVDSYMHFEKGELPTVDGVTPIVHPLFENTTLISGLLGEGEIGLIGAWSEDGICKAQFDPMESLMAIALAEHKGQSVAFIHEFMNCARIDDLRVVQGAIVQ